MRAGLQPAVASLLRRHKHAVFLGGDHSITLPILREYRSFFGRPLAVLHFDGTNKSVFVLHSQLFALLAHCDTWTDHYEEPSGICFCSRSFGFLFVSSGHGTWVYEAIKEGLVVKECFVQVGIRSAGNKEARDYVKK